MFFKHNMFFFQKKHCFFCKKNLAKKTHVFFLFLFFFCFLWLENSESLSAESKYSIKASICAGKFSRCNLFIVICLTQMSTDKPCCALIQGCKLELEPKKLERFIELELDKIIFGTRIHLLEHVGVQANKVKCRILWLSTARVKIINLLKKSNIFVSCFSEHHAVKRI